MTLAEQLKAWCARPPRGVVYDEGAGLLLDVASGKTLKVPESELQSLDGETRLVMSMKDGRELALSEAGISFAPGIINTGVLEELGATVCWNDFHALATQLKGELYGAAEPGLATVRVLMCCLAIVDGGRAAGFDVAREEQELEWHLKELERRAPG